MERYEYFLLDWDGNLAKTLDIWLEAIRVTLERRGIHHNDEEMAKAFGAVERNFTAWGITDMDAAIEEMDTYAKHLLPEVVLYPDALEVLEKLRDANKKIALITSSVHENIDHLLAKHNVSRFFDAVVTGDDIWHHKPHAEPLEKALQLLGGTKDKAVMIGDSDKDLGAAQNAGIDSILFYPDEHRKYYDLQKLQTFHPTYIVRDFRDVLHAM